MSLPFTLSDLHARAGQLLALRPDPAPRLRLLRDVLQRPPGDTARRQAAQALDGSRWVELLVSSQQADGTWGRFHSQDSRLHQPFPTTEAAITAALDLGLERDHPLLARTVGALEAYLQGAATWPDRPEKHDNPAAWPVWVRHISAAVLAQLDPLHPGLDEFWHIWAEVVAAAFSSGAYDRQRELAALNALLGCHMRDPMPVHKKYPLLLLSSTAHRLPPTLERALLDFVLAHPPGIYYVYDRRLRDLPPVNTAHFWRWLAAHRLLARFPLWPERTQETAAWIWAQQDAAGLWPPGPQVGRRPSSPFPLSESWRRVENRAIDGALVVLDLLARWLPGG